ncbi:hypothetical protein G5C51_03560 [Streptomyces sp. A7024]|uniref:Integral membrane protein n=1 Tax=Streptomyces coryli TaxID=1128680 RepID=A0A6G4TVF9_9ACTN|nr:hypothetical protein [Streptomyces coryli]NGN62981.1 hypothetical protein [Streptomyces coryli]
MGTWFDQHIAGSGRLPLFAFFVGLIAAFAAIRVSVRMIRAGVRWWPGNIKAGETHIHHVVFGVVFMVIGGAIGLALPDELTGWRTGVAAIFGIGTGLVLDEFALILHLEDVYWTRRGRTSIDAVFVAVALIGMILLGLQPIGLDDWELYGRKAHPVPFITTLLGSFALAVITLLKGKIWTGLLGIFLPPLLVIGAIRLSRPRAPWARWRYGDRPRKQQRAERRERRLREPVVGAKVWVQELLAGRHDLPERPGRGDADRRRDEDRSGRP